MPEFFDKWNEPSKMLRDKAESLAEDSEPRESFVESVIRITDERMRGQNNS